jgi:hypothetical protein
MACPVQGTHMASRLVVLIFPPLSPTVPAHGRRTRCGWAWTAPGFVKIGSRCFRFLLFCDFAFLYLIPSYVDCQSCSIVWPIMPGWPPRFAALRRGGASACADLGHGHSQGGGGSHPRAMRASPPLSSLSLPILYRCGGAAAGGGRDRDQTVAIPSAPPRASPSPPLPMWLSADGSRPCRGRHRAEAWPRSRSSSSSPLSLSPTVAAHGARSWYGCASTVPPSQVLPVPPIS